MKKIAVIVCNNGLGHLRRVALITKRLLKHISGAYRVEVFTDLKHAALLDKNGDIRGLKNAGVSFYDVSGQTGTFERVFIRKYVNTLKTAQFIWSDNLVFPLKYRKDTVLSGSFLWFDVFKGPASRAEKDLVCDSRPFMVGNRYFAMDSVRELTRFKPTGMFNSLQNNGVNNSKFKKNILISLGMGGVTDKYFYREISSIEKEIKKSSDLVFYIEPRLYGRFRHCRNVAKAQYSPDMFRSIGAAVIRPGLGTVNDVLCAGGRIFGFSDNNYEIKHNLEVLGKLGAGAWEKSPGKAVKEAISYVRDIQRQKQHKARLKKLDFSGLDETVKIFKKLIKR